MDYVVLADDAYKRRDWAAALALYDKHLAVAGNDLEATIQAVRCELQLRQPEAALRRIEHWERQVCHEEIDVRLLYERLRSLRNARRFDELSALGHTLSLERMSEAHRSKFETFLKTNISLFARNSLPDGSTASADSTSQLEEYRLRAAEGNLGFLAAHPHLSEPAVTLVQTLLKQHKFDDVDDVLAMVTPWHLANSRHAELARIAVAAARPITALGVLTSRTAQDNCTASDKVLLDVISRLNLWGQLADRPELLERLVKDNNTREALVAFVDLVRSRRQSDRVEGRHAGPFVEHSRLLFDTVIKRICSSAEPAQDRPSSICIVAMHAGYGGAPRKAMRLALELCRQGYPVSIVFEADKLPVDSVTLDLLTAGGVRVVFASSFDHDDLLGRPSTSGRIGEDLVSLLKIVRPLYKTRSFARLAAAIELVSPSVVHVIGTLDLQICAYIGAKLAGVTTIVLNPGMLRSSSYARTEVQLIESEFHRDVLSSILRHDDKVVFCNNSIAAARDMECWLGLESNSVAVLKNGVVLGSSDAAQSNEFSRNRQRPVVAVIGRLAREKNPKVIIDAFSVVVSAEPEALLIFAGSGPLLSISEAYAERTLPSGSYSFLGNVDNVSDVIVSADCVLLVSDGEGLPNTLIEAQALGVPVVSTDAGGAKETFIENVTGVLVDLTEDAVAAGVLRILGSPKFSEASKLRAGTYAVEYSMERMASDALALYRSRGGDVRTRSPSR